MADETNEMVVASRWYPRNHGREADLPCRLIARVERDVAGFEWSVRERVASKEPSIVAKGTAPDEKTARLRALIAAGRLLSDAADDVTALVRETAEDAK